LDSSIRSVAEVPEKALSSIKAGHLVMAGYLSARKEMLYV
jgi:hypothetical protein